MAMVAALATANALPDAVMQYALPDIEHIAVDPHRLQRRRDRMLGALRAMGYQAHTPEATFYPTTAMPNPGQLGLRAAAWSTRGGDLRGFLGQR